MEEGVGPGLMDHAFSEHRVDGQVRVSHTYLAVMHVHEWKVSQQKLCDALTNVHGLHENTVPYCALPHCKTASEMIGGGTQQRVLTWSPNFPDVSPVLHT